MALLPCLTQVTTYGYVFTAEELDRLKADYPGVTFNCKFHMAHHIIRTDLTAFCTRHAKYTKNRHTQADFAAFRHCPDLKALDIGHNAVTDIRFLKDLPKLQILIVADNQISDLEPLRYQNQLVYLELIHNDGVTDISPLADLTELIDLHIGKCTITDFTPPVQPEKAGPAVAGRQPHHRRAAEGTAGAFAQHHHQLHRHYLSHSRGLAAGAPPIPENCGNF